MAEEEVKLFVKDVDNRIPRLEMEAYWPGDVTLLMSTRLWWPRPRICSSGMQMKRKSNKTKTGEIKEGWGWEGEEVKNSHTYMTFTALISGKGIGPFPYSFL